jgi:glycosyltransferase involved in cell wall biosynthesis
MRVLIVSPIARPEIGGPVTYVEGLVGQSKFKYKFKIVAFQSEGILKPARGEAKQVQNDGVRLVSTKGYFFVRQIRLISEIWRNLNDVDLIYVLDPLTVGVAAALLGKFRRVPVVVRFAGDVGWEKVVSGGSLVVSLEKYLGLINQFSIFNFQRWLYWFQRWVLKSVQAVVVPGKYLKKLLVKYYGLESGRVEVVRNAIDRNPEFGIQNSRGLRMCSVKNKNQIVAVGRLVAWKNFDVLIKAFGLLLGRIQNKEFRIQNEHMLKLVIVGDGPERGRLERLVKELKVENQVKFAGRMDKEDAWRVIKESRVLVLPSSYEGMSHVLLESMALGTPVVASDIKANREMVKDGETGLLFSLGDEEGLAECLMRVLKGERLRKRLARNAKKSVEKYNWERHMKQLGKLFGRIRN